MDENMQKQKDNKFLKGALAGALVVFSIMFFLLLIVMRIYRVDDTNTVIDASTHAKLQEIDKLLQKHFLYDADITDDMLSEGLYRGYVDGLGDIYSAYYDAEENEVLKEDIQGVYSGIGAVLSQNIDTKIITVMHTYKNSPAKEAGLEEGDIIYKVDGEDVLGQTVEEAVSKIRGEEGIPVELTVYRGEEREEIDIIAIREQIEVETVIAEMKSDTIGYIRVTEFRQVTFEQYQEALEELYQEGMEALIVDLRNNPGGNLNTVGDMLGIMLPTDSAILTMKVSDGSEDTLFSTPKGDFDKPLVVLVNEFSASASEIYAGAIKDHQIGTIVGMNTFGKGVIQQVFPLRDGSSVKLTIAEYFTSNGNKIHEEGVEPDVEIKFERNEEGTDNQLEEAMKILEKDLR